MHDRLSFRRKVISVFDMCIMLFDMNIAFYYDGVDGVDGVDGSDGGGSTVRVMGMFGTRLVLLRETVI